MTNTTININGKNLEKSKVESKLQKKTSFKINKSLSEYAFKIRYEFLQEERNYKLKWSDIFDHFILECQLSINNQSDAHNFPAHIYQGLFDSKINHIYSRMTKGEC